MKAARLGPWVAIVLGLLYFVVPLLATFEFSLRKRRGVYSFDAYRWVFEDPRFAASFGYSVMVALCTILVGVLLVVPTAYWVRLKLPRLRPVVEFITLMPLVIPAIVVVFGYCASTTRPPGCPLPPARGPPTCFSCSATSPCRCPTCIAP